MCLAYCFGDIQLIACLMQLPFSCRQNILQRRPAVGFCCHHFTQVSQLIGQSFLLHPDVMGSINKHGICSSQQRQQRPCSDCVKTSDSR